MDRPKVGLALGSGGARGFSHLGVLKVLTEHNISIDYIAGTSMGALIGAFYGAGQTVDQLYTLAKTFKRKFFLDVTVPRMGFIQGDRLKEYIQLFTYGKKLEEFHIPVAIVAANLNTGKKVVFQKGDAASAVRASIGIPGIFVPEKMEKHLLVDGGVIDRVPVSVVRDMGADIVIAVDCSQFTPKEEINSIYDVILQSIDIMQHQIVKMREVNANIVLKPKVSHHSLNDFSYVESIIEEGEKVATAHIKHVIDVIEKWKEK
ncbi:patatin-like phospholipase family protein [Salirhabdus salicampi]|uniref:patatin-like phospholipase family protein n=1 Tax=Salirhabdus salicampi TaxID=476102 RepID=UPI0020C2F348|nr:patatin-like phospholipase family protein [Salirhabdus salicampi]MCP8616623.1 patatin-like phospholipase family protein [Salirhabdus salicampi]